MSNNQSLGIFHWIRESVRRSVLLGFSDAVEQLGVPSGEAHHVSPHLLAVLRQTNPALSSTATPELDPENAAPAPAKPERKRLGRSLDQLRETSKPAPGRSS